jgi:two-component system LytT family response regulator
LKIAICDDDKFYLEELKNKITKFFNDNNIENKIFVYDSATTMLSDGETFDMIFSDIEMQDISGIDAAKTMMQRNKKCFIFFITNYSIYLDNAFDVKAFRYLSKPVDDERLYAGIRKALEIMKDSQKIIRVRDAETKIDSEIKINDIIYIENHSRKAHIILREKVVVSRDSFKTIKEQIEQEVSYFAEPYQSYFVNLHYVVFHDREKVILKYGNNEYTIYMSRRKYNEFNRKMFEFAEENL